jgi:hypothetical protein
MGGHGGMGMGHAGMGMGRGMGMPHASIGPHGGFTRFAGVPHTGRFVGRHFAFRNHRFVAFRHHRFFRHRFAFVGVGGDDCWTRVWTRWGWRLIYVCY